MGIITTGQLEDMCKRINAEYGYDSKVCTQIYDENGNLKNGDYALSFSVAKDGTLYLTNK